MPLGIGVATGAYGLSFGALAVAAGLSVPQACALVAADVHRRVAVRVRRADRRRRRGRGRDRAAARRAQRALRAAARAVRAPAGARGAVRDRRERRDGGARHARRTTRLGFWSTGLAVFVCWNLATLLGALGGAALSDPRAFGLDAAAPAGFLALLAPRLREREPQAVAALAAAAALISVPLVPAGVPVLVAAAVAVAAAVGGGGEAAAGRATVRPGAAARRGRRRRRGRRGGVMSWTPILLAAAGCYALKLAGLSIPQRVLDGARVQRVATCCPSRCWRR